MAQVFTGYEPNKSGENTSFKIELLNINNYETWKISIEGYLRSKGLWIYLNEDYKDLITENDDTGNMKLKIQQNLDAAMGTIQLAMSPAFQERTRNCNTAKEIWDNLGTYFKGKEAINTTSLIESLVSEKLKENESVDVWLKRKRELQRRLTAQGVPVADKLLSGLIIQQLPESMTLAKKILRQRKDLVLDEVEQVLQDEETERYKTFQDNRSKPTEQAHITQHKRTKKLCEYCEKLGSKRSTTHQRDFCWIDPESKHYKPEVAAKVKSSLAK